MYRCRTFIVAIVIASLASVGVQADSPPREKVKEVKFHAGYTSQLKEIETEACDDYSQSRAFRVFQSRSVPTPGAVKTVNFGYSCVHPDNPRGGWLYLRSLEDEIDELVAATATAMLADQSHEKAGQVIADAVYLDQYPYRKNIFPDYLPDDPALEYKFWTYKEHRDNPKRMEILVYRRAAAQASCPPELRRGKLSNGNEICYKPVTRTDPPMTTTVAWHDHTVFEEYTHQSTKPVSYGENTLVLVDAPKPAEVLERTDTWKYERNR